jgi:probable addiction module antidote protein
MKASVSHDEWMMEHLCGDPAMVPVYIEAAMAEEDPGVLLIALRHAVQARGGIATVAEQAGLNREALYRALSENGNPELHTLRAVLRVLGLRLAVATAA